MEKEDPVTVLLKERRKYWLIPC